MRETEKLFDVIFMECQRGVDVGEEGSTLSTEKTPTTIESSEDKSSAAGAQQISDDLQIFEDEVREAGLEEASQQDKGDHESSTDTKMPPLVGRARDGASSDNSTSNGPYNYHTDNDNSSI